MEKVFIDTNIFLGLYETNNNNVDTIFDDILKLKDSLVFMEQVHQEFLRNRDSIIQKQINLCKSNKVDIHTTSLIRHLEKFKELNQLKSDFKQKNKELIETLKQMESEISKDPILVGFDKLYQSSNVPIFDRTEEIIQRAKKRLLLGNPPIDKKKGTIGDQIIWETILENIEDDLIIVTEDTTYSEHKLFLENEYSVSTGKNLYITDKISYALAKIGKSSSQALKDFENSRVFKNFLKEDEVKDLLSHFTVEGIEISSTELYEIFEKSEDNYDTFMELIGISEEIEESYKKPYHSIHSDYITIYRKYFNPEYSPYIKEEEDKHPTF